MIVTYIKDYEIAVLSTQGDVMVKKFKSRIRDALRDFLGISSIERKLNTAIEEIDAEFLIHSRLIEKQGKQLSHQQIKLNSLHDTISNVVSVGSDVVPYGRGSSWAVVCIEGQYNVVKFFDLSHRDGREMLKVLKAFEGGRYVNDTPHGFFPKEYFVDWLK